MLLVGHLLTADELTLLQVGFLVVDVDVEAGELIRGLPVLPRFTVDTKALL